ncbi:MAG: type II secretion system F family protein [Opitutaceae bacterium]|nr:type II secretion system F family protein [Verrucomicrobiales bacterium]
MKYDEFAFLNQQLAGMLKSGIPLEGALRQLCETMKRGSLRAEFEKLGSDLAKGEPLVTALGARQLPPLYIRLVAVGVAANDLPGILTLLADYYQGLHGTGTRLKGLMVYPVLVLFASLALSIFLTLVLNQLVQSTVVDGMQMTMPTSVYAALWFLPLMLGLTALVVVIALLVPGVRRDLRWMLPGFREASLAQLATAAGLMLQRGVSLADALALLESMENHSRAGKELAAWRQRLVAGHQKFSDISGRRSTFPPLFIWLVASAGEDLAAGFKHAAEVYQARSVYRTDLILYGALPVAILFLGLLVAGQTWPVMSTVVRLIDMMGSMGP